MLPPGSRALLGDNHTASAPPPEPPPAAANSSFNGTGFFAEDDGEEAGYTDMQTVFLACVATLIPLVTILIAGFIIRFLWGKLRTAEPGRYEGVLQREDSSDPLGGKSLSASGNLLPDELKTSESQFSVTPAEEIRDLSPQSPLAGGAPNHAGKSANGSIITMTLKNNHLIVETEEREVAVDDGAVRTTTKFTATSSPHENGVFVVEVQRGAGPSPARCALPYPGLGSREDLYEEDEEEEEERAQVHRPAEPEPDSSDDEDDEDQEFRSREEEAARPANTGLSQSDLSASSAGSCNPSYRYGDQVACEAGRFGYPEDGGEGASPTPSELEDERLQEEQRVLGNCRAVPGLRGDDDEEGEARDLVPSLQRSGSVPDEAPPPGRSPGAPKRASLPAITPGLARPLRPASAHEYDNRAFVPPDQLSS